MYKYFFAILSSAFLINIVSADTLIEGLNKNLSNNYSLSLELSDNDTNAYLIGIHPVNNVSVRYSHFNLDRPQEVLKSKITDEEYELIYLKALNVIGNFEILEKPHFLEDAVHYKLTLNVNRREISIKYYSVSQIKDISQDFYDILEMINKYLSVDKKLKY